MPIYTQEDYFKAYKNCNIILCKEIGKQLLTKICNKYISKDIQKPIIDLLNELSSLQVRDDKYKVCKILEKVKIFLYTYNV